MVYYAWMHNKTDCQDDEPMKIWASSNKEAKKTALDFCRSNFYLGEIFTARQFRSYDPDFYDLMKSHSPVNISEFDWRKIKHRR